jgi:multidrug efflux pump subunit AcrA (membrane-fusion protein)
VKVGANAPRLVAGMKAKVTVHVAELKSVLLVPASAVVERSGAKWCTLKGATAPTAVKTGETDGKMVELLEGLKEGDEVLVQPSK